MKLITTISISIVLLLTIQACGDDETTDRRADVQQEEGLTDFELEHGIGPITERIEIDEEIDQELLTKGRDIYEMKCEMCHNMEGRMVGPELGNVLDRRSPEFVMNFILNPGRMAQDHPEGQKMLREYMTVMPFQNVKEDEARAIVEYLRYYAEHN
ncbi:MAG: cytochrome c [Balneolaceae bacterium]|nr:MAG: cytochrome c [Balneolaceae bacterium]